MIACSPHGMRYVLDVIVITPRRVKLWNTCSFIVGHYKVLTPTQRELATNPLIYTPHKRDI